MRYRLISDESAISDAFEDLARLLGASTTKWVPHPDHGFKARVDFPDKRHVVKLRPLRPKGRTSMKEIWIAVRPSDPLGVQGLMMTDERGTKYVAHTGKFNKGDSSSLRARDDGWVTVDGDSEEKRYLITALEGIDNDDVLAYVADFVRAAFSVPADSSSEDIQVTDEPRPSDSSTPLNRILFGPPGTGKTYDAISEAVSVIDGRVGSDRYSVKARFDKLREEKQVEFVTFHQNYAYEDFIEGIRPVLDGGQRKLRYELRDGIYKWIAERAKKDPGNRYVLIIDEINRGNIAKIFGELITLIEPSKRIGADDAAETTLPYSQESFGVPDNLYLIGTMNTADRGITELDVALRRRFEFVRRMPNPDHERISEDINGVDGRALLRALNRRIVEIKDRDHQIGHTYLIDVATIEQLKRAFQVQVIPLLEEYFYDDWEKIRQVLNDNGFITERKGAERSVFDLLAENDDRWLQAVSYQDIYGGQRGGTAGE